MRLVFLADTHGFNEKIAVPDGDILIHCGDATNEGTLPEVNCFANWFGGLPHKHKIFVAGNHDWLFQRQPYIAKQICKDYGIMYLEDQGTTVEGLRIYGTPWTPNFMEWAFMLDEEEDLEDKFQHIPGGLDVLITHGPPYGILDEVRGDFKVRNCGSRALKDVVLKQKPRVHAFGHIHLGYGQKQTADTHFINAAVWWTLDNVTPKNIPICVDLEAR